MNQQIQQAGGPSTVSLLLWVMTSARGRISREVYWLALLAVFLVHTAFMMPVYMTYFAYAQEVVSSAVEQGAGTVDQRAIPIPDVPGHLALINLGSTILWVIISIKRLHDFNASGLFAIFLIFPIVSFFATILIGLIPGTPTPNRFGEHTDRIPPP